MKVIRKCEVDTNEIKIGDQITFETTLPATPTVTATAMAQREDGAWWFLVDEILDRMDHENAEKFCRDFPSTIIDAELRSRCSGGRLPSYGMIFGHDDYYESFEPDDDEQFELMRTEAARVANCNGETWWWWLSSENKDSSASIFAHVDTDGAAGRGDASYTYGARPLFLLRATAD